MNNSNIDLSSLSENPAMKEISKCCEENKDFFRTFLLSALFCNNYIDFNNSAITPAGKEIIKAYAEALDDNDKAEILLDEIFGEPILDSTKEEIINFLCVALGVCAECLEIKALMFALNRALLEEEDAD